MSERLYARELIKNGNEHITYLSGAGDVLADDLSVGAVSYTDMTRVRTVGVAGCQFTTIDAALADLTTAVAAGLTASATQPLVILVHPGYYQVGSASKSYGIDLTGATSNDGGDGTLTHVHLVGIDRASCVIEFINCVGGLATGPRLIDGGSKSRVANLTLVNNLDRTLSAQANRFIHFDVNGTSNYFIGENITYKTTTAVDAYSMGIGAGQVVVARNQHMEGAGGWSAHGKSSGGTWPRATLIFDGLTSDGTITDLGSSNYAQSGINIDGQTPAPVHGLTAIIKNIGIPEAAVVTGGTIGLTIKYPIPLVATGGSTTTLQMTGAGWDVDALIGESVQLFNTNNTNFNVTRAITDNDATSITFSALSNAVASGVNYDLSSRAWVFKTDGSIRVQFAGTITRGRTWNTIHFPQPQYVVGDSGPTLRAGAIGVYEQSSGKVDQTTTLGAQFPLVFAVPVGNDATQPRSNVLCTGPYCDVAVLSATTVAVGDIIVASATALQADVDNTQTDPSKILGWAESTKANTAPGYVLVRRNRMFL